jgi:hypothetical protein
LARPHQAAYVRRLWRHPDDGGAAEVQLIIGKTVERALGRDAAIALMDSTKVGCVVAITGRVQPHPAGRGGDGQGGQGGGGVGGRVLDVVVHSLDVLHRSPDALAGALRRAERRTGVKAASAAELDRMGWLGPEAYAAAFLRGQSGNADAPAGGGGGGEAASARAPARRAGGGGAQAPDAAGAGSAAAALTDADAASVEPPEAAGGNYWRLPIPLERVHDVIDMSGLQMAREAIFQGLTTPGPAGGVSYGNSSSSDGSSGSSSSSSGRSGDGGGGSEEDDEVPRVVVGLDVEWRPFDRGQPHTPAALLQVG